MWDLSSKDEILASQGQKLAYLYRELRVVDSREIVDRFVTAREFHRPLPDALREAIPAG